MKTISFLIKKLYFVLLWLLLGLGLFSCEPDPIEIDLPAHQPKLVIATQVAPEKYMLVQVSKSFSSLASNSDSLATDTTFMKSLVVEHALVQVTFNGRTETLQHLRNGLYMGANIVQYYGLTYTLFVRDSVSELECTAVTEMQAPTTFEKLEPEVIRTAKDTTVNLHFTIADQRPEKNFYLISLTGASRKNVIPWKGTRSVKSIQEQIILVNDDAMQQGRYSAKEKLTLGTSDSLVVTLTNISEPYYRYLELYRKSGNLMNQLTGEPINLPTNIQNGYGYFSAHNPTGEVFNLREW
ncbi:DUF4249 family protein [Adhaeribacter soli]|uniref:DUF4249 family protein n=1 Tax=Adhaeribacter soli TaxID=2607655 RepID=A0A5N1IP21_9BACT|nr:DUF4249 family protein [Adhaeribacter soli]KAA9331721.1 DUF4249 family protein [Adhaeribacter soli]